MVRALEACTCFQLESRPYFLLPTYTLVSLTDTAANDSTDTANDLLIEPSQHVDKWSKFFDFENSC